MSVNKVKLLILFGGHSSGYEDSLTSATTVITHLDHRAFTPILVGITREGNWYYYAGDIRRIEKDTWHTSHCYPACLSPNRRAKELLVFRSGRVEHIPVDMVFPVLHGKNGEDGKIQGLCEMAAFPLVGSNTLTSAICLDKELSRRVVSSDNIPVPFFKVVHSGCPPDEILALAKEVGYPLSVTTARSGSLHSKETVSSDFELLDAVEKAFEHDRKIILEEAYVGTDVGCALLGDGILFAGDPDEVEDQKIHLPARLSPAKRLKTKDISKRIYRLLGCQGLARVDFYLGPDKKLVFNKVSTMPALTLQSRFTKMMHSAGIPFEKMIATLLLFSMKEMESE